MANREKKKKPAQSDSRVPASIQPELVERLEQADVPPPIIEALRSGNVNELAQAITMGAFYSGPLPPASEMIKYKEADPSAPGRILAAFEQQSEHRRSLERRDADDFIKLRGRGQWFAFIIILAAIIAAVYSASVGQPWIGASIVIPTTLGIGALGLISLFQTRK